jgi:hypothetical protein
MTRRFAGLCLLILTPAVASAQISWPKTTYYLGMGDSVAAGDGALPVTKAYVYELYDRGVFARKQQAEFSNVALKGARSWDLLEHQVPQVLCAEPAVRPTVVTITAGANDFLLGDQDISGIAQRVAGAVRSGAAFLAAARIPVPAGAQLALVDFYTPSLGRQGLVTIERSFGYSGPFDFDIHPTNLGHSFIAREFERMWNSLP